MIASNYPRQLQKKGAAIKAHDALQEGQLQSEECIGEEDNKTFQKAAEAGHEHSCTSKLAAAALLGIPRHSRWNRCHVCCS